MHPYIQTGRRHRAIYGIGLGAVAAKPKVSDQRNRRCQGRIALDNGEVDFRYHPCEAWIVKVCLMLGYKTWRTAQALKRSEVEVMLIMADLKQRGEI